MKLKLTLLFIVLAIGVVFLTFKKDILSYQSVAPSDVSAGSEVALTKEVLANYFQTSELVDYRGATAAVSKADMDAADRVIVHLWASWCAPCVNEVPDLIEFAKREKAQTARKTLFIAVSLDENSDDLNKFLKSFPDFDVNTFVRLWDKKSTLSKLVNADRLPMTVMLLKDKSEPRVVRGVVEWKSVQF